MNRILALSVLVVLLGLTTSMPSNPPSPGDDSKVTYPHQPTKQAKKGKSGASVEAKTIDSTTEECKEFCINRYGTNLCCEGTPFNEGLTCPPAPRIDADCGNPDFFKHEVKVKACSKDSDCGPKQRCCTDSCDVTTTICMPGDRNLFYLFP